MLAAMLVFALPSFADVVDVDMSGGAGDPTLVKFAFDYANQKASGSNLPIALAGKVGTGEKAFLLPDNVFLNFSLDSSLPSTNVLSISDGHDFWLTGANIDFEVEKNTKVDTRGKYWSEITLTSGTFSVSPDVQQWFADNKVAMPNKIDLSGGTIRVQVDKDGKFANSSQDIAVYFSVPEPMTTALLVPGIGLLGLIRRRFLA